MGQYRFQLSISQPTDHRRETAVQSANLILYRRELDVTEQLVIESPRNIGLNTVFMVYQTLPGGMRRLVTSTVVSLARYTPLHIDITPIVQTWIDEPTMNYGIEVECISHNISTILLPNSAKQPAMIDIYTYEKSINTARRKRALDGEDCSPGRCCRQPVNITLADVGLHSDEIHEVGETMTAYVCTGRCSRKYRLHSTWSSMKDKLRSVEFEQHGRLKNKCAPTAYEKSYRHFYYNHETGEIAFMEYDDIIVAECSCV